MYFLALLSLAYAFGTNAQTVRTIAYDDLPKLVRERNANVKAAESQYQAQKERSGYLTRSFLPSVSARAGNETFKTGSSRADNQNYWMLEGKVNIYRGGRDMLESKIRDSSVRLGQTEAFREYNFELKEARQNYWKLVAVGHLIKDREEALKKNEAFIKSSRRRSGAGISTNADTVQFELHKTLLQQELKKLTLEQDLLRNRLSVAIGLDEHESLNAKDDFPHPPDGKADVASLNISSNSTVRIARELELRERLETQGSKRWWLPRVDLYSSYGVPSLRDEYSRAIQDETEWTAGVQVGFDLMDAFEARKEARAKSREAEAQKQRAVHKQREIVAADHELRHDLNLLHELMHDADRDIKKAESFLRLTQSEYSRGVRNGPDLLEAFKSLYDFRQRRTSLYQEYYGTRAELMELIVKDEAD